MKRLLIVLAEMGCITLLFQAGAPNPVEAQTSCAQAIAATPRGPYPCTITLNWTDNSSGTGQENAFEIQRALNTSSFADFGKVAADVTTFADSTATEATIDNVYYYRVRAVNSAGASGWSNAASFTIPAFIPPIVTPPTPTGLKLSLVDDAGNVVAELILKGIVLK